MENQGQIKKNQLIKAFRFLIEIRTKTDLVEVESHEK